MSRNPLQRDLVVLYIASQNGEWVHARELKASPKYKEDTIGSEGDRRAQEIFPDGKTQFTDWEVNGRKYRIERGGNLQDRMYRLAQYTPKLSYRYERAPNGLSMIKVPYFL